MLAATTDPARRKLYSEAIARLEAQAEADFAAASAAEAEYQKLCRDAGVDATLNTEICECSGCLETRRILEANIMGRISEANANV
jgi:Cdc6-like AAA superfamily ATPase